MNIGLMIQTADRSQGGAEGYTLDLARSLSARGHQVTLIAEQGSASIFEEAKAAGYKWRFMGAEGPTRWHRTQDFLTRLKEVYGSGEYEIVHAMLTVFKCDVYQPHAGFATDSWLNGHMKHPRWIVRRWARRFNRFNLKRRGLARVEQELMERQPWTICSSSAMRDFARLRFAVPENRLVRLMNGIDLSMFEPAAGAAAREAMRREWNIAEEQLLALLIATNWRLKGVQDAIEALGQLKDPRVVLVVVGREDQTPYRKQAERLGVLDRIRFIGRVDDVRGAYGAADFVLLPTRRDTCSLVVLEALAMGLPVITTLQNGANEVMEDGKQGVLLDRGAPAALAQAIRTVMDDPTRHAMARAALALRPTLSIEHHVDQIEKIYQRVLNERAQPRQPQAAAG